MCGTAAGLWNQRSPAANRVLASTKPQALEVRNFFPDDASRSMELVVSRAVEDLLRGRGLVGETELSAVSRMGKWSSKRGAARGKGDQTEPITLLCLLRLLH